MQPESREEHLLAPYATPWPYREGLTGFLDITAPWVKPPFGQEFVWILKVLWAVMHSPRTGVHLRLGHRRHQPCDHAGKKSG